MTKQRYVISKVAGEESSTGVKLLKSRRSHSKMRRLESCSSDVKSHVKGFVSDADNAETPRLRPSLRPLTVRTNKGQDLLVDNRLSPMLPLSSR